MTQGLAGKPRSRVLGLLALVLIGVGSWGVWKSGALEPWMRKTGNGTPVLLISIDTLRADAVGFLNPSVKWTPNLDKLAQEGVVFEQATAAANHTAPSHASMLTGISPAGHGVINTIRSSPVQIPATLLTLAERFRADGYATLGATDGGYMRPEFGFDRGFDQFTYTYNGLAPKVETALSWIASQGKDKPWFVFLHTYDVHGPYLLPREQAAAVLDKHPSSWVPAEYRKIYELPWNEMLGHGLDYLHDARKFAPRDIRCVQDLYAATVEAVDKRLGLLFEELKQRQVWDSLLLVITSDHGEEFLEHNGLQHNNMFDEIMRVPLLVKFPKGTGAGVRVPWPIAGIDLTPTISQAAGFDAPPNVEGRSHVDTVLSLARKARVNPTRTVAFANHFDGETLRADVARTPVLKVFHQRFERQELLKMFDLTADPGERRVLKPESSPAGRELVEGLRERKDVWDATLQIHGRSSRRGDRSDSLDRDLRNLGYFK